MKSNDRIALAVGATAGIASIALLAVLRSDSPVRRRREGPAAATRLSHQLDTWDNEGGSLPDEPTDAPEAREAPDA